MIKYLFVIINSFALFLFGLFNTEDGITLTSNIPTTITAGQEIAVELVLNKGDLDGFARFQLDLPEGLIARQEEENGATFINSAGVLTWEWLSLPETQEIKIKFRLSASENTEGKKTVTSKFSFVENNEKKTMDFKPIEIVVLPVENNKDVVKDSLVNFNDGKIQNVRNVEPMSEIRATRKISLGATSNEHIVTIKINKANTKGFARYSDDIFSGLSFKPIKTDGSSFSISDGKLKFVWVSVPEKEDLEISYSVKGNLKEAFILLGEYSYLENNQSRKFSFPKDSVLFEKSKTKSLENKEKILTKEKTEENTKTLSDVVEKKEGAVNYVVQIGAFKNENVNAKRIKQKFKITEAIRSEMQEGFSKFLIGSHVLYRDARYHRDVMKNVNGVKTAFVTAYSGAKRITVQEALMISNQKWFK